MKLFDRDALCQTLESWGAESLAKSIRVITTRQLPPIQHGKFGHWQAAWEELPTVVAPRIDGSSDVVRVTSAGPLSPSELTNLYNTLMHFHPWRKGPFEVLGVTIDTEWRSNLKWDRFHSAFDFAGKRVLDVGSGNGYYGWRMLAAGAEIVLGLDPTPLYIMQFEVLRKYAELPERHFLVPLADIDLPENLRCFDLTCSMGVLYHRPSPVEHLQRLYSTLRPGGELLLETLVVEGDATTVLVPEDRFAKMRNVWFIPSLSLLARLLTRVGFRDIEVIDVSVTTVNEQRATAWMTYQSLPDFLDPDDPSKTIEGYPSPCRGIVKARA
ncbi:MAG: tRNA 5-methoxyuridine(34)/uridine 5-oxyacetic acid(34) synthase CmoB [Pirellulaceae bacterium]